jgi:uncharacterized protein
MTIIIAIGIGLLAGVSSGLFGIGGGILIVPMVAFFFKFTQQSATATSLVALLLPVGALGVWQYYQNGFIAAENFKIGFLIAAGVLFGTLFGAKIAASLSSENLTKIFAVFLIVVAVRLWWSTSK